jgi:hypothetical protein
METESNRRRTPNAAVIIALTLLIVFGAIFAYMLVALSDNEHGADELTQDTYMDIVAPLLINADAERGKAAVELRGCNVCHAGRNAGHLAPSHEDLWKLAAERRPSLTAAAYVYESIIYPGAFIVDDYYNNMPRIYHDQIPDDELGDIIAYLLTPKAEQ